ncbi:MAG: gliding motility protein [Crocinitomicaceae bacterium]|nr:gliding motility protein [Crocinitomicaceae bacterium]|tara:strand:+ start:31680 stop:32348 length:669 start_codon:yes stop_codon:yes gene_type:complete
MKKLILGLFVVLAANTFAQTDAKDQTPKDPKAKAILDKLSAKTKSYTSITAKFQFRLVNKTEGIDDKQSGTLILKGEKYKVLLNEMEIVCNSSTVWTYMKDVGEVQLAEVDEAEDDAIFMNPKNLFTLYETGFKYVLDKDATKDDKAVHVIRLYPLNPGDKPYHTIILNIDKAKMEIQSLEMKSKDGNTFIYTIESFTPNKAYPDSFFEFKTPEGVEEIDLR